MSSSADATKVAQAGIATSCDLANTAAAADADAPDVRSHTLALRMPALSIIIFI